MKITATSKIESINDTLKTEIDFLQKEIKKLERKITEPRYKEGDIALMWGYRKVKIVKVIPREKRRFLRSNYYYEYEAKNVQTGQVEMIKDGVTHIVCFPSNATFILREEELTDVPENYETYLVHLLYNVLKEERK